MMKARSCQKESAGAGVGPIKPGLQEEDSDRVALIRGLFGPGQEQAEPTGSTFAVAER